MEMYINKALDSSFLEAEEIDIVANLVEEHFFKDFFKDKNLLSIYLMKPETNFEPARILHARGDVYNHEDLRVFEQLCWNSASSLIRQMADMVDDGTDRNAFFRLTYKPKTEKPMQAIIFIQKNSEFYTVVFVNTSADDSDSLQVATEGICGLFYAIFILLECGKDYDPPLLEAEGYVDKITGETTKKFVVNWFKDASNPLIKEWHALIKRFKEQEEQEE